MLRNLIKKNQNEYEMSQIIIDFANSYQVFYDIILNQLHTTIPELITNNPELFTINYKNQVTLTPLKKKRIRFNFTKEEVADHHYQNDAWIIIDEDVQDITQFLRTVKVQHTAQMNSLLVLLMNSLGKDFTEQIRETKANYTIYKVIKAQFEPFKIGELHEILSEDEVLEINSLTEDNDNKNELI